MAHAPAPPYPLALVPLRAFTAGVGEGVTVAVLFRVLVDGGQHQAGAGHQHRRDQQAEQAVGAAP